MILELHFWKERNLNRFWYCIRQKLATVIDIVIAKCCQHVLILVLLLQSDAGKYWYWYWYCRLEAVAIDIDIERKFSFCISITIPDHILQAQPRKCARKRIYVIGGSQRELCSAWARSECTYDSVEMFDVFNKSWVSLYFIGEYFSRFPALKTNSSWQNVEFFYCFL